MSSYFQAGDIAVDERVNLTRQLDNVYSCLKRRLRSDNVGQIGFYEFCLDPNDFARSVENIFYVSFLIKETRVKIVFEEDFPQIGNFVYHTTQYIEDVACQCLNCCVS